MELEDYDNLKKLYDSKLKELENKNQMLYDANRKIQVCEALMNDLKQENDTLKSSNNQENVAIHKKYEEKVLRVEEKYNEKINDYLFDIKEKNKEIENLNEKVVKLSLEIKLKNLNEVNEYVSENSKLKDEIKTLNEKLSSLEEDCHKLIESKDKLEQIVQECNIETSDLKENLNVKIEDLKNTKEQNSQLQEELLLLKNEMLSNVQKPQTLDSKGNSLFAEVNDRRLELQENISSMKKQYNENNLKYVKLLKNYDSLVKEKEEICQEWKNDLQQLHNNEQELMEQLQKKLEEPNLHNIEETTKIKPQTRSEYNSLLLMIENKNEKIKEMQFLLDNRIINQFQYAQKLRKTSQELRNWKQKAYEYKCVNDKLTLHEHKKRCADIDKVL